MAKLFGKRGKARRGKPQSQPFDPRSSYAIAPLPRPSGPPASSTPLADQLSLGGPGVTEDYIVLPRALAEQMPLPWQHQAAAVLAQFQHMHQHLDWPRYRVLPSREELLVNLDEEQLAEAGYLVEMDSNGDLVYRERNGRKVENPEQTWVLVTCLDPIQSRRAHPAAEAGPAAMNVGPEPVWEPVPNKAHHEPPLSFAPAGQDQPKRGPAQHDQAAPSRGNPPSGASARSGRPAEDSAASTGPNGVPGGPGTPPGGVPAAPPGVAAPNTPAGGFAPHTPPGGFAPNTPPGGVNGLVVPAPQTPPGGIPFEFGPTGEPTERPYRPDR